MKNKRPTVKDVAREAGVSIATVSRALSDASDVKASTRKRIFDIVKRTGYRANQAASDLRRGRSRTLLVLVSEITNAFFSEFFKGIEEEARSRGYVLLIGDTSDDAENERVYSDMLLMNQAGGLILNTYGFPQDLWPADSQDYDGPPIVSCAGHKDIDIPVVRIDDALGGRLVGEHLISLGHRNIIQVCGPLQVNGFERRYFGFCQALKAAGLPIRDSENYQGQLSTEFGLETARLIAERDDRPTAVFVHNDETAIGLLHGLANLGIRVPEDMSVVGYDDMPYAAVFNPGLTTVHLPKRQWGRLACDKLIALLEDDPGAREPTIIAPSLIARGSTAPPDQKPSSPSVTSRIQGKSQVIRTLVWGENVHEQSNQTVAGIYPDGMHACIAESLAGQDGIETSTATLQEPDHGLTQERIDATDVLIWWGHAAHGDVADEVVDRVADAVWGGMGLIALHSAHFSKIFKKLMGTPCNLTWREAGERERIWVTSRQHPIARGLPSHFELEHEEMYGEPFAVPEPLETVFVSWFQGGEVFRSGLTYRRGAGNIFYFRPGHETYPTFKDPNVQRVLANAVRWAHNPAERLKDVHAAPNTDLQSALEPLEQRGPKLHADGEEGFR